MLCMLTVRRLKPGSEEEFAGVWAPERWHSRMVRAYALRRQDDPREVVTLGFFEGSEEEIDAMRDDPRWMAGEEARLRRIAPHEDEILISGVFEVIDEVAPAPRP
jgi:hypothetical protein